MPTIEVDEVELMNLRRLGGIASRIQQNPKGRKLLEQAYKEIDPQAATPTLDAEALANEPIDAMRKEMEDLKKQLADEKAEGEKNARLADLQRLESEGLATLRRDGWTDEGITGVKELMEKKGILDPLDAAAIFERDHPRPQPVTPSGHGAWGFMDNVQDGEKDLKSLIESRGENNSLIDRMAREALADIRGPQTR